MTKIIGVIVSVSDANNYNNDYPKQNYKFTAHTEQLMASIFFVHRASWSLLVIAAIAHCGGRLFVHAQLTSD